MMIDSEPLDFESTFTALTGHPPFPWQTALYRRFLAGDFPTSCDLPTGLGKTSVIPIWLIALAEKRADGVPRRLVYVVNRRTVVDQATREAENLRKKLTASASDPRLEPLRAALERLCAVEKSPPLAISTLRGQHADNREWYRDPARPAVIVGTVDMIGSRLLFSGYGCGFKTRPLHAGFLGRDSLLVHDEAHLEKPFQDLLVAVENEQNPEQQGGIRKARDYRPLRVLALTATPRGERKPFGLMPDDEANEFVRERLDAKKRIKFHTPTGKEKVAERIGKLARDYSGSGAAVLVFVRTIEDVDVVRKALKDEKVEVLTGTIRGKERDELVAKDVFKRFLKDAPESTDTAYLVCTSAGEVGIDISADHLVCDLTPFDSMAQRFGRVNRYGKGDAKIDVVREAVPEPKKATDPYEQARWKTFDLLGQLPEDSEGRDASPGALGRLRKREDLKDLVDKAYTPTPTILPVSDILFDAWALTTINRPLVSDSLPGRPEVAEYLHGIEDDKQFRTSVAWRKEVWHLRKAGLTDTRLTELLDEYPLKPQELLSDSTFRKKSGVADQLAELAARFANCPVWVQEPRGGVRATTLEKLTDPRFTLVNRVVILPPEAGGLAIADGKSIGTLDGTAAFDPEHAELYDVADVLTDRDGDALRWHGPTVGNTQPPEGMRRATAAVLMRPDMDDASAADAVQADDEAGTGSPTHFQFFMRRRVIDDEISKLADLPVTWEAHTDDVLTNVEKTLSVIDVSDHVQAALRRAARFHDLGKRREWWQRSIGNPKPTNWHAKSGGKWKPWPIPDALGYRHEFGSLLDVADEKQEFKTELDAQPEEVRELALHLIATHHGRGRPHFPNDEAFDPDRPESVWADANRDVPRRFARLQRQYGRWGLAYIESLLRAADYEASANPTKEVTT